MTGILRRLSVIDNAPINKPALAPHLDYRNLGEDRMLLVSETFNTILNGSLYCDIIPLLDGSRDRDAVTHALAKRHDGKQVGGALDALARRGYVVSAEHGQSRGVSAQWSAMGASPRWVEERLNSSRIALHGDCGRLQRALVGAGLQIVTDEPTLSVFVSNDYLDEANRGINEQFLASSEPWLLVQPAGMMALFGPVFDPGNDKACWECLAHRLRGHREVYNFLRNRGMAPLPAAASPATLDAVCALAANEILRWLHFAEEAPVHRHAISFEVGSLVIEKHLVERRSACQVCGDPATYRPDRPVEPVCLKSSPKRFHNSGGSRSETPEQTIAKFSKLVSPVSGVVTWVSRMTKETDPWLHVHWSGSNLALNSRELVSLRQSLRSKCAGKGSTSVQSKASALCEAVERYSNSFQGTEPRSYGCAEDFGDAAIYPNDVQLFSDQQFDERDILNSSNQAMNLVPQRLNPKQKMNWSPIWSFTEQRHKYLPTSMLYSVAFDDRKPGDIVGDSNGCAAGNTLEEAILQGFFELVERDAFAIWWYNMLQLPGIDLCGFGNEYLSQAAENYDRFGREIWALDATSDLGIPVFVAMSRRRESDNDDIIYASGAHLDPTIALMRAVCELNQFLNWVEGASEGGGGIKLNDPLVETWFREGRYADLPFLRPCSKSNLRKLSDYQKPTSLDTCADIEHCRSLIEEKGMEFLVLDQTRDDIGMPVARVVVPGLRHFWARLAPGRLYSVPVAAGLRQTELSESELNQHQVVI